MGMGIGGGVKDGYPPEKCFNYYLWNCYTYYYIYDCKFWFYTDNYVNTPIFTFIPCVLAKLFKKSSSKRECGTLQYMPYLRYSPDFKMAATLMGMGSHPPKLGFLFSHIYQQYIQKTNQICDCFLWDGVRKSSNTESNTTHIAVFLTNSTSAVWHSEIPNPDDPF